jgi:hypothetical protein
MSSPFQNRIKKQQRRNERLMRKAARISARQSGESMGGIDYELPKVQKVLGKINKAKTISYNDVDPRIEEQGKRYDSGINYGSPLNAYVSTAGHFQRMQDKFAAAFTPTKGTKTKAEKEAEFKGETEKVSKKLKETTDKELKGFKDGEYQIPSISDFQKNQADENYFNRFGQ